MRVLSPLLVLMMLVNLWTPQAKASDGPLGTVKEMFLKGSIDGKNMFMVLGLQDASRIAGEALRDAVTVDELRDVTRAVYNRNHDDDVYDSARNGARFASETAKQIAKWPWKSIKKIPGAHRINMERAREAYYGDDNAVTGVLKYSAWATWAKIQGAYYLVIEAPTKFAIATAGTVLAVPFSITVAGLRIALEMADVAWRAVSRTAAAIAVMGYSAVSTTVAVTVTGLAAGAVAVYNGTKWLVKAPLNLTRPVRAKLDTGVSYDKLKELGEFLSGDLDRTVLTELGMKVEYSVSRIEKYKGEISFNMDTEKAKRGLVVKLVIDDKKVKAETYLTRKAYKALRKDARFEGMSRKEIKAELSKVLADLVARSVDNYNAQ